MRRTLLLLALFRNGSAAMPCMGCSCSVACWLDLSFVGRVWSVARHHLPCHSNGYAHSHAARFARRLLPIARALGKRRCLCASPRISLGTLELSARCGDCCTLR